ncbi:Hypothetical predicted protein [Pelobates cultripes]|uniref:Uncharacterized protein n=1 Tax=Pelobates cultripes TaxID=61616 RepID=A0AAD1VTT3_PELCU|nr:Hypothetical predicted protein [Pelobates cultripes]
MADTTRQSANMETSGKSPNYTLTKLDAIFAAFWTRIAERALNTAKANRTTLAPTPPALPGTKRGRKMIADRDPPKRHRKQVRWHKQKRRAFTMTSTHPQCKLQQPHSGLEPPCPPGQRRSTAKARLYHPDTWHLVISTPLKSQETGAPGDCIWQPEGIG